MKFFHTVITTRISRVPLTFNPDIGIVWIADGIGNRRTFSTLAEIYFSYCVKTTFLDIFRLNAISLEGEKKYFFVLGLNPNVLILTWRQKQKGLPLSLSSFFFAFNKCSFNSPSRKPSVCSKKMMMMMIQMPCSCCRRSCCCCHCICFDKKISQLRNKKIDSWAQRQHLWKKDHYWTVIFVQGSI